MRTTQCIKQRQRETMRRCTRDSSSHLVASPGRSDGQKERGGHGCLDPCARSSDSFKKKRKHRLLNISKHESWPTIFGQPNSSRNFISTHFDINYLPETQARTEELWETARITLALHVTAEERSRSWHGFAGHGGVLSRGAGRNPNPTP
jgi:hypothetical protein